MTETNASPQSDPRPAAVTFITTEHFVLQGERSATVSEAIGRASVFLGSVSGGLIALGLIGQASRLGTAFYAFGLILLPTLSFVGLTAFHRVFQTALEDVECALRIAQLRGFYFEAAPEVERFLVSVRPEERLEVQGIHDSRVQMFLSISGTLAVITAVLVGSTLGLVVALVSGHNPAAAFPAGGVTALATLGLMMRYLNRRVAAGRPRVMAALGATLSDGG